MAVIVE
jgi:hypothetical protein